jgi:hypothetical protein
MDRDGFIAPEPLVLDGERRTYKKGTTEEWFYQGAPENFGSNNLLAVGSYGFNRTGKQRDFRVELPK